MKYFLPLFLFFCLSMFCYCSADPAKESSRQEIIAPVKDSDSTSIVRNEKLTYVQAYDVVLSLWNISFHETDIKTSFGNAHVIMSGPEGAEPVVLLHGMNASSTMWYPNIKAFSEHYRVYAIDFLLEPGKSLCQGEMNSTDEIVKWYYEIFDQLKLKKFSIVGASRGGWLAMNIAMHDQSRINRIALLSPAQAFIWIKPGMKILSNVAYTVSPKRKRLRSVLETMTFNVDQLKQEYINQYYIATEKATMNKCILQMTPFSDKQLQSLKIPVLVMIGDNDIINNEKSITRAKSLLPNVETELVRNAGHFLSIDEPEEVNKRVLNFLGGYRTLPAGK